MLIRHAILLSTHRELNMLSPKSPRPIASGVADAEVCTTGVEWLDGVPVWELTLGVSTQDVSQCRGLP